MTKYGISQRAYPHLDIRVLTLDDATAIYHRDYWTPIHGDDFPAGLALLLFDCAVNQGMGMTVRLLQKVSGVTEDGSIGPVTLRAVRSRPLDQLLIEFCAERALRQEFNRNEEISSQGWYRRLLRMYATALGNRLLQVALVPAWHDSNPMQPNDSSFRLYPTRTISGYHDAIHPTGIFAWPNVLPCMPATPPWERSWWTSAAGICHCITARSSTNIIGCAASPACSTCRT
ncbi:MAG: glycosyl hydrolase 108 family protein [Candidatus Competibacter sp.]|nr:glycosyl hydrolase 108 family protein [Candidatus Competibacter sp.]